MQKEFLWQGKRAKIKHSTMIGSYEKGGLKDVDLESKFQSLRIIWVRRILDEANFHPWMAIANTVLKDLEGVNIFQTNLLIAPEKRECLEKIPTFYKEVISPWEKICIGTSSGLEFILSRSLWNNHFVTSEGKTISSKHLESKGILMVVDLIDNDGKFSSWEKRSRKFTLSAVDFLEWYEILRSIPREWKNRVKEKTHFFLKLWMNKYCLGFIMVSSRAHVFTVFVR